MKLSQSQDDHLLPLVGYFDGERGDDADGKAHTANRFSQELIACGTVDGKSHARTDDNNDKEDE
jgi:hypothetical protein